MNADFLVSLGRLEGKVDALLQHQTNTASRLDHVEKRQTETDLKVAGIEARGGASKDWKATLISLGALAISALGFLKGLLH
jgi:hypothetical protein